MNEIIRKEHNISTQMDHIVCPAKYWRAVISEGVDKKLREICLGIEAGYEIRFLEIGTEVEHVDDLVQSEPKLQSRSDRTENKKSPEQALNLTHKIFRTCYNPVHRQT